MRAVAQIGNGRLRLGGGLSALGTDTRFCDRSSLPFGRRGDCGFPKGDLNPGWCYYVPFAESLSDACKPWTEAELRAAQAYDLAGTAQTPENQQAAIDLGDAYIEADRRNHPEEYCEYDAAIKSPTLSQVFGPAAVCRFGGPDGMGLMLAVAAAGVAAVLLLTRR